MVDPNKLLYDILDVAGEVVDFEEDNGDKIVELCRMICDLDDWLLGGGFMPERWDTPRCEMSFMAGSICARPKGYDGPCDSEG